MLVRYTNNKYPSRFRLRENGAPMLAGASGAFDGALEVDHGAVYVSMETSKRLACDASLVHMRHDADGALLSVGRKTRTIPPSIRRALAALDTSCHFPGCTSRRCDAHHIERWADGGATRLDNLVRLCRRHHRAVHEGGFGVIRGRDGILAFLRPDGAPLHAAPDAPLEPPGLEDTTPLVCGTLPTWDGTRFDLACLREESSTKPGCERSKPSQPLSPKSRKKFLGISPSACQLPSFGSKCLYRKALERFLSSIISS